MPPAGDSLPVATARLYLHLLTAGFPDAQAGEERQGCKRGLSKKSGRKPLSGATEVQGTPHHARGKFDERVGGLYSSSPARSTLDRRPRAGKKHRENRNNGWLRWYSYPD